MPETVEPPQIVSASGGDVPVEVWDALEAAYPLIAAQTLRETYWKLREHASAYRDTRGFRTARERWEASGRSDDRLYTKTVTHEFYARGIEAAAREVAELLGVAEHEIEPVDG